MFHYSNGRGCSATPPSTMSLLSWNCRGLGNLRTVNALAKLKHLKCTSPLPWLVIGDFNEIMGLSEKEGGSIRPRKQMEDFVSTIDHCGLCDLGFIGSKFTWLYQTTSRVQIRERLDRALATLEWMSLYPTAKLHHLSSSISDHSPLSLHLFQQRKKRRHTFFFFSLNQCG